MVTGDSHARVDGQKIKVSCCLVYDLPISSWSESYCNPLDCAHTIYHIISYGKYDSEPRFDSERLQWGNGIYTVWTQILEHSKYLSRLQGEAMAPGDYPSSSLEAIILEKPHAMMGSQLLVPNFMESNQCLPFFSSFFPTHVLVHLHLSLTN